MMKRIPLFLTLLLGMAAGCSDWRPVADEGGTLVKASITATEPESRADFDASSYCQLWRNGDRISLFDLSGNTAFDLTSGAGTTSATFQSEFNIETSSTYYALYPYDASASLVDGVLHTVYPDTLRYDAATGCALGGNLMAAKGNGTVFTFYNAATFIELQITGAEVITGITLTANDGSAVAGAAEIAFEGNRPASVTMDPDGAKSIYVDCGEGIALSETPTVINIAVAPVFSSGFTLDFTTRSQRVLSRRSSSPTVMNTLLQMPAFRYSGTSYATLVSGSTFNSRIKNLANNTTDATSSTDNTSITCVAFETGADLSGISGGVDVSADGDGSILATFYHGTITVHTSCDSILTGSSGSYIFSRLKALTTLEHPERLLTRNATTLRNMFHYCVALKTLDVSWVSTDNATNITSFFNHCEGLTSIDISSWNPARVTDLSYLFNSCTKCTSITLGERFKGCRTSSYYCLFYNCSSLQTLDEENLNFSSATNLNRLFAGCAALRELDFDTAGPASLTKADSAFYDCKKLERVNLGSFNTKSATQLRHLFNGCNLLSDATLGANFMLTAKYRNDFFPALTGIQSSAPSRWKLPPATAQTLVSEFDTAAEALRTGILILENLFGNAYVYKNAQKEIVSPTTLATLDEVKSLTVAEP